MPSARTTFGKGPGRRSQKRHEAVEVTCDLGDVRDLTVNGLRLSSRRRPPVDIGAIALLKLTGRGAATNVRAKLVWTKRRGLRKWEMGFKLASSSAPVRQALETMLGLREPSATASREASPVGDTGPLRAELCLTRHYTTLGVKPGASPAQVRAAYHRMARKYHPDLNKSQGASARFMEVKQAYDTLRRSTVESKDAA